MSKQTILERAAKIRVKGNWPPTIHFVEKSLAQATEERFQAERERTEKENLETINVLVALQDLADNATKSLLALEARVNTLTAHTDPSLGLLSDKTSPL